MPVSIERAQDRFHVHTRKVLTDAARKLAAQSVSWHEDRQGAYAVLGGVLILRFWFTCDGNNVYGTIEPHPPVTLV